MNVTPAPTAGYIARFWSPLAATWIMMSLEGPLLAALIARLPDPKINLAAYGVAFSIAILVEAPVMMLMSLATALVRDCDSYRRLRLFTLGLNALATMPLCLLLIPPVFDALIGGLLRLPAEVADLTYGALWFFVPWTAAIGYRRFVHGVMIRAAATRRVAAGPLDGCGRDPPHAGHRRCVRGHRRDTQPPRHRHLLLSARPHVGDRTRHPIWGSGCSSAPRTTKGRSRRGSGS